MKAQKLNIQGNLQEVWSAQHRSLPLVWQSKWSLTFPENQTPLQGSRCFLTKMDPYAPICASTIFAGWVVIIKVAQDRTTIILIAPTWQSQPCYTMLLQSEHKESSPSPKLSKPAKTFPGKGSSIDKNKEIKIGYMTSFTQQLATKGTFKKASKFVFNSRRTGTQWTWNGISGLADVTINRLIPFDVQ